MSARRGSEEGEAGVQGWVELQPEALCDKQDQVASTADTLHKPWLAAAASF